MNKHRHIVIIATLSTIAAFTQCMYNNVIVETSGPDCILPQHKIEESRLLLTKQEWQAFKEKYHNAEPANITLKTISAKKLDLFSAALDAKDFPTHFKHL